MVSHHASVRFGARGVRQRQRKSEGVKQTWTVGFDEQGQRGNPIAVKGENMDGVRAPRSARDSAAIGGEGRLPVSACRPKTKAAIVFPHLAIESTDGVAARIPLPQWRHSINRVLLKQRHEAVEIQAFPGLHITADETLLSFIRRRRCSWPTVGIALGERIPRSLESTVDRGRRSAKE